MYYAHSAIYEENKLKKCISIYWKWQNEVSRQLNGIWQWEFSCKDAQHKHMCIAAIFPFSSWNAQNSPFTKPINWETILASQQATTQVSHDLGLSDYRDSICYPDDSLGLFTIMIVDCLSIWIVILLEFLWNIFSRNDIKWEYLRNSCIMNW